MPRLKNVSNKDIAQMLREISAAYEAKGENRFKVIAYNRAADSLEHASEDIKDIWETGKLDSLPGVGGSISQHLDEFFKTGKVKHFEQVKRGLPSGMFEILKVPGIGPKSAYKISKKLKVKSIKELKRACNEGKIATLEGFGDKSQEEILKGIAEIEKRSGRILLPAAYAAAQKIITEIKGIPGVERIDPLGSLRRMVPTIGDVDIAVATRKNTKKVVETFINMKDVQRVLAAGEAKASVLLKSGIQADLRVQNPDSYGAQLQYFTGSKHHNIALRTYAQEKGLSLSEYGIKNLKSGKLEEVATEEEFYRKLGLDWIPPELREDTGEIETALKHKLPKLVELKEIKGDLHVHSDFKTSSPLDSGKDPLEEVLKRAQELKYEYVGFADHAPRITSQSSGSIRGELNKRKAYIENYSYSFKNIRVLIGLEVDIFSDGSLCLPDEILKSLDYSIASVHSAHRQSKEKMTERLLSALKNPYVNVFGHPTGRLLGEREAYDADWEKIYKFCTEKNIFVEINAHPIRLDIPDMMAKEAKKYGVKFIIGTDSHSLESFDFMRFGVAVARRGWLAKKDIVNTSGFGDFVKAIEKRK